jgi:DNA-directed RNA polymerase specialized sigma24 family protein
VQDPSIEPAALAARIQSGDTRAERLFVERFSRGVRAILRHTTQDAAAVDDLFQETFRIGWRRSASGRRRPGTRTLRWPCLPTPSSVRGMSE